MRGLQERCRIETAKWKYVAFWACAFLRCSSQPPPCALQGWYQGEQLQLLNRTMFKRPLGDKTGVGAIQQRGQEWLLSPAGLMVVE